MIKLAKSTKMLAPSAMQTSLNIPNKKEYISFALGLPANEALPFSTLKKCMTALDNNANLQYSPTSEFLKKQIKNLVQERGINCDEEEIFITAGAQQGISLVTRLLVDKGSTIITEELIYPGFLQVAKSIETQILTIQSCYKNGINLEILQKTIEQAQEKPALIYIVADGNNPLALSLDIDSRKKLVSIAKEYKIPILEDDPYGFLFYSNKQYPALKSLEKNYVCYVGSFSKIIAPALRVGWIIVPKHLISKLSILKESSDINTATLTQRMVSRFIENGYLTSHLYSIRKLYQERRDVMHHSIKKYLPDSTKYLLPENGIYFWLEFEKSVNTDILFKKALTEKVIIIPGNSFSAKGNKIASNCIRLNFSFASNYQIEEGIRRLAKALG